MFLSRPLHYEGCQSAKVRLPRLSFGPNLRKPNNANERLAIMRAALKIVETLGPSEIATLPFNYRESDGWKDTVMRPKATATGEEAVDDFRTDRFETPQYQERADELAADPNCPTCIFVE